VSQKLWARGTKQQPFHEIEVHEAALPVAWVARLRAQLRSTAPSTVLSFYALDRAPRSFLEQSIVALHAVARPDPGCVGAEYWWRVQPAHTGFHFHFDRDEAVKDRVVSPQLSSILYLSDAGGPTLIVDAVPGRITTPRHGVGVFPQRGRYATFPGSLFHGVWAGDACHWPRIVFFVNWWKHRPRACVDPSPALLSAHPLVRGTPRPSARRRRTIVPEPFSPSEIFDDADWRRALARQRRVG